MKQLSPLLVAILLLWGCGDEDDHRSFIIPSAPMAPTYNEGERITVDMSAYDQDSPERWDIVLLHFPPTTKAEAPILPPNDENGDGYQIFRVVGLPGETISYEEGHLRVDGRQPDKPSRLAGR